MAERRIHRDLNVAEERLRAGWVRRGMPRERAAAVARRNVVALDQMNRMGDAAMRTSDELGGIKLVHCSRISELARATYSRSRKVAEESWPAAFAGVAMRYIGEGVNRASVLVALEACWDFLPHALPDAGFEAVLRLVEEGEKMKDEVRSQNAEVGMRNEEEITAKAAKSAKAESRSGTESYHKDSLCQTEFDVSLIRWRMI